MQPLFLVTGFVTEMAGLPTGNNKDDFQKVEKRIIKRLFECLII